MNDSRQYNNQTDYDTIAAVITPPGEGGIAAVRIAGPASSGILDLLFQSSGESPPTPFLMRHGVLCARDGAELDEVMAVFMPAGRSYTGLDQVEIFCHGGRLIVRRILAEILAAGARAAEPGEFTRLAFLNGRINLARAEAVAEMIAANTDQSLKASREHLLGAYTNHIEQMRSRLVAVLAELEASIDMSEEDITPAEHAKLADTLEHVARDIHTLAATYDCGRIIKEGFCVAIAGRPNAGKSSLFNRLLAQERALVNPEAGTTRDYLSEWVDLDGFAVNVIDTAGLRDATGEIECMGQAHSHALIAKADLLLWVCDITEEHWEEWLGEDLQALKTSHILLIANKIDLVKKTSVGNSLGDNPILRTSCKTGDGLPELRGALLKRINEDMPDLTSGLVVTSARHKEKLEMAGESVAATIAHLRAGETPEISSFELRQGVSALGEITGRIYTEEILGQIFSTFCVGK